MIVVDNGLVAVYKNGSQGHGAAKNSLAALPKRETLVG